MTKAPYVECAESKLLCSWCGGKCCNRGPGKAWPSDFKPDVEANARAALGTGRWVVGTGWCGKGYYLTPKQITNTTTWGGVCAFWHESSGCELPYAKRPRECRLLEPAGADNGDCKAHSGGTEACIRAWRPYREFLREMYESQ